MPLMIAQNQRFFLAGFLIGIESMSVEFSISKRLWNLFSIYEGLLRGDISYRPLYYAQRSGDPPGRPYKFRQNMKSIGDSLG